uniref:SMP-30/Gluconolactonase/LRE-like region domain-containing protein n=1 Tax=Branchiostoma floridae TaxID=7739 RepID=C3ZV43_BRAFL|eukprot:XP_002587553.1 hypothetical protein BRAFLDRAFT_95695 [Branchiostoma floridae]
MNAENDQNASTVYAQNYQNTRTVYAQNDQNTSTVYAQNVQNTSTVYAQNDQNTSTVNAQNDQHTNVVSNTLSKSHGPYDNDTKIIIIEDEDPKPGVKYRNDRGVVVSAGQIFVSDLDRKVVQVYGMKGKRLRKFPTVMPGENGTMKTMLPCDIAIDGQGHLWVPVLKSNKEGDDDAYVVQYRQDGRPVSKFAFQTSGGYPHIDFDIRTNKIIMVNGSQILMFHPNGTLCRTLENERDPLRFQYATSDKNGNILATEISQSTVQVYDSLGQWLFKFGGYDSGEGWLNLPRGIRVDSAGHILVADEGNRRVANFTSQGEFLRNAAEVTAKPWNFAIGPEKQLVVTSSSDNTITIIPDY